MYRIWAVLPSSPDRRAVRVSRKSPTFLWSLGTNASSLGSSFLNTLASTLRMRGDASSSGRDGSVEASTKDVMASVSNAVPSYATVGASNFL